MIQSVKDVFMDSYKVFKVDGSTEKYLGIISEDGVTLTLTSEDKEVRNGHTKSIMDKYKFLISAGLEFKIKQFDVETLKTALPGVTVTGTGEASVLTVRGKAVSLRDSASVYVLRPYHDEDDESKKIVLYCAANDTEFSVTFKVDEETTIPFKLLGMPDDSGKIITIGNVTI